MHNWHPYWQGQMNCSSEILSFLQGSVGQVVLVTQLYGEKNSAAFFFRHLCLYLFPSLLKRAEK